MGRLAGGYERYAESHHSTRLWGDMALRHESFNQEELARQRGLDRSWRAAQEALRDAAFRDYLESAIDRVNSSKAKRLTSEEFLTQTEPAKE